MLTMIEKEGIIYKIHWKGTIEMFLYILIGLFLMNLLSFFAMLIDKKRAEHRGWRVPEWLLIVLDLLGGSIGGIIAMQLLPHKSNHLLFSIGLPITFFVEYSAIVIWYVAELS
jgi:uncharacterized membrane protein YsdA (DUF1294 family)